MLALSVYSARLLSAGRAFVAGEAQWAKAQKDAVLHLMRYAAERDDAHLIAFERSIAVLDADRRARLEFVKGDPDLRVVGQGLKAGGVHESEIDGLVKLYYRLRGFEPFEHGMALWQSSDPSLDELHAIAARLRDGQMSAADATRDIYRVSESLAPLEHTAALRLPCPPSAQQ